MKLIGYFIGFSGIIIESSEITDKILSAEGYVSGLQIETEVKNMVDACNENNANYSTSHITHKEDIVSYGNDNEYTHFEYFIDELKVDTKGGFQKDEIIADPGTNIKF
jgi:hypothetical protein